MSYKSLQVEAVMKEKWASHPFNAPLSYKQVLFIPPVNPQKQAVIEAFTVIEKMF